MEEKLIACFTKVFNVDKTDVVEMSFSNSENWDSINHMLLVEEIESAFSIVFDPDSLFELKSFVSFQSYVREKVG